MDNRRLLTIFTGIILISVFLVVYVVYKNSEMEKSRELANKRLNILLRGHAIKTGVEDAEVVLVEFLDPLCEGCRFFHPIVKQILSDYEGKIKLIIRYASFHEKSQYVVRILEAARLQEKYWETLDFLFLPYPKQGSHSRAKMELIWEFFLQSSVDIDQLKQDMNHEKITEIIEQDLEDGKKLGVRHTPTFFINGIPLMEYGEETLRAAIKAELKK